MKLNRKIYETRREKRNDFIGGFFGWFLVNFAAYFILSMVAGAVIYLIERLSGGDSVTSTLIVISILPLIFNVGLIYFLAKTKKMDGLWSISGYRCFAHPGGRPRRVYSGGLFWKLVMCLLPSQQYTGEK